MVLPDCALWSDVSEDMELERKSFNLCRQILSRKGLVLLAVVFHCMMTFRHVPLEAE